MAEAEQQIKVDNLGVHPTHDITMCEEQASNLEGFAGSTAFSTDTQTNAIHYNTYASRYDKMQEATGFNDPYAIAKAAIETLGQPGQPLANPDLRLFDFGCGTGLMGQELNKAGYNVIYGLDGSGDMVAVAETKDVYKKLWEVLVGITPLPAEILYDPNQPGSGFDAIFSSACMIKGHFPNVVYEEMLKVLRPGGHIIFSIRDIYMSNETDSGQNYVGKLAELEAEKKIIPVASVPFIKYEGLDFGTGYHSEPAAVKIYQKPADAENN